MLPNDPGKRFTLISFVLLSICWLIMQCIAIVQGFIALASSSSSSSSTTTPIICHTHLIPYLFISGLTFIITLPLGYCVYYLSRHRKDLQSIPQWRQRLFSSHHNIQQMYQNNAPNWRAFPFPMMILLWQCITPQRVIKKKKKKDSCPNFYSPHHKGMHFYPPSSRTTSGTTTRGLMAAGCGAPRGALVLARSHHGGRNWGYFIVGWKR